MKKKLMPLVLMGLLTIGGLVGCGEKPSPATTVDPTTTVTPTTPNPTTPDPSTPVPSTPTPSTPTPSTPSTVHVDSIEVTSDKAVLVVGETATLTVTILPENADDKTYTLTSSDTSLATVDGTVVTALAAGEVTITATSNDGAKVDSVTITINNPAPAHKEIPFSLEADLEEKTISYWAAEEVTATTIDNEDGTYGITYTSVDASWIGLQILYKNSDLVEGQAYLLNWSLNSAVAGDITVNGQTLTLIAGDNDISIKYVCGTDTSATTGLYVFLGTPANGLLANGSVSFSVPTWTETSLHDYDSENWTQVEMNSQDPAAFPAGTDNYWWFENEPNVTSQGNPIYWTNGLANNAVVDANYDLKVNAKGTADDINAYNQQVGLLAWYHDADNYVLAYGEWNQEQFTNPARMRQFHIGGRINGTVLYGDFWADFEPNAGYSKPLSFESLYEVSVRTEKSTLKVSLSFNGNSIGSKDYNISHIEDKTAIKAGIYCAGPDTVTFSNYTYNKVEVAAPTHAYSVFNQGATAPVFTMNDDDTYSITATDYKSNFILKESELATGKYSVSATLTSNVGYPNTYERQIGLVPWYVDSNNFILVYAQYCNWEPRFETLMREVGVIGKINGQDIEGPAGIIAGYVDFWGDNLQNVEPSTGITLSVTFDNGKISPSVNGTPLAYHNGTEWVNTFDLSAFATTTDFSTNAKVGYYIMGAATEVITATDVKVTSLQTLPVTHDWAVSLPVGEGPTYTVNEDKSITVTSTGSHKANLILSPDANAAGTYTVSTTIKSSLGFPNVGERCIGLIPWYVDDNNYVVVYAQYCDWDDGTGTGNTLVNCMRELNICGTINGQDVIGTIGWVDFWATNVANVDPSVGITLSVKFDNGVLSPSINGTPIGWWLNGEYSYSVDLKTGFASTDFSAASKVGVYCNAGATEVVTFSGFAVTK